MGQDPGRGCARVKGDGTGEAQTKTEQSWQGENRGRFEETMGRKEGRRQGLTAPGHRSFFEAVEETRFHVMRTLRAVGHPARKIAQK